MTLRRRIGAAMAIVSIGCVPAHVASGQTPASPQQNPANNRTRTVLVTPLPKLQGAHLKATVMEVRYGPGESSLPHTHGCAVTAYVVQGAIRTQMEGEAETIYKAGGSFYEPPNTVHLVSANASATEPAMFVASFVCDHDTPLTTPVPKVTPPQGAPQ